MYVYHLLIFLLLPKFFGVDYDNVKLLRTIDGDTIVVDLPCRDTLVCKKVPIRIFGLDTPEMRARCEIEKQMAVNARDYLQTFLKGKQIDLRDCKRDDFYRLICSVKAEGEDVATKMIAEDLAYPYEGKSKRKNWCKE